MPELETPPDTAEDYSAPNNPTATTAAPQAQELPDVRMMSVISIAPSPLNPRRSFDEAGLTELANSLRMFGMQQPIVVRPPHGGGHGGSHYQIVMGERRWRAAKMIGMHEIPVIVMDMEDAELAERALSENLQRADLNCVEEAQGYQNVLELSKHLTQMTLAQRLGVSQPRISNSLRLLTLPVAVQTLLAEGKISRSHGIELASIAKELPEEAERLARKAWQENWSQDVLQAAIKEVKAKAEQAAQPELDLTAPATPKYVHPTPAQPAVVAEKVTTTETTKTESLSAAGTVIAPPGASTPSTIAPTAPPQDALLKEANQTLSDAAKPAQPVSAAPTTPAQADDQIVTTVPSGPRVATSISAADDDYLFEAMLTIDQLFTNYKKLADNPFALSSNSIKYLKALTDNYNEKHVDEPLSPIEFMEFLLASEATDAGFDIATLKEIPE